MEEEERGTPRITYGVKCQITAFVNEKCILGLLKPLVWSGRKYATTPHFLNIFNDLPNISYFVPSIVHYSPFSAF